MADESTAGDSGSSSGSDGGIDQGSYVNDAFDDYFEAPDRSSPRAETDEEPKEEQEAKKPKEEVRKPEAKTPQDKEENKQPDKKADEVDPFDVAFRNDDGSLNLEALASFKLPEISTAQPVEIPEEAETTIDPKEAFIKSREEERVYETNLRQHTTGPLDEAYALIRQGKDPVEALKEVYQKVNKTISEHVEKTKLEREWEREQERKKDFYSQQETQKRSEAAKVNIAGIVNNLPGKTQEAKSALFNRVIFGKDAGAELLEESFQEKYPDYSKKTPAERNKLASEFVNEMLSDQRKLHRHYTQAMNAIKAKNMGVVTKQVAQETERSVKQNGLSAQKNPAGTAQRQQPSAKSDGWDTYLNGHNKTVARIN